jgi:hypothetical protein
MSNILRYLSPPLAALVAYFLRITPEDKVNDADPLQFMRYFADYLLLAILLWHYVFPESVSFSFFTE